MLYSDDGKTGPLTYYAAGQNAQLYNPLEGNVAIIGNFSTVFILTSAIALLGICIPKISWQKH